MENKIFYEEVINSLDLLKKIYDYIRIVNPMKKTVKDLVKEYDNELGATCYNFWKNKRVCNNCISARAFKEENKFMKFEYNGDKAFLVSAMPIEKNGQKIVLELLKDVSEDRIIEDIKNKTSKEIYKIIESKNLELVKDSLTEVYNRRFIDERLPHEFFKAGINNKSFSIIMADIDYFKRVNDNYGHIAGDIVLKRFAQEIKTIIREKDWVSRYGGEEFLVFLSGAEKERADFIAERIRKAIEKMSVKVDNQTIKITSSFGVATFHSDIPSYKDLVNEADRNLYRAKRDGRNRVI